MPKKSINKIENFTFRRAIGGLFGFIASIHAKFQNNKSHLPFIKEVSGFVAIAES
ncbi:hypothetical protein HC931_11370 [Candidatus Gracilibacteria bacterium]|nr:hypothetical protein [Candidatus Gracilibacteria bacterium]NJM86899.1 hypothetical protein [Hydrococcus sp. RU_2_2]NJP20939.1 hypothetical protein [Hydrococcus sp. CRU_1_1]